MTALKSSSLMDDVPNVSFFLNDFFYLGFLMMIFEVYNTQLYVIGSYNLLTSVILCFGGVVD